MKKSFILSTCLLLSSLSGAKLLDSINSTLTISPNRDSIKLRYENIETKDYLCQFDILLEFENPRDYSFAGESRIVTTPVFIKRLEDNHPRILSLGTNKVKEVRSVYPEAIIKEGHLNYDSVQCREASFMDYCSSEELTREEKKTLELISQRWNVGSGCFNLANKMEEETDLDLSISKVKTLRPLLYAKALRNLNIKYTNTSQDEGWILRQLELNPEFKLNQQ